MKTTFHPVTPSTAEPILTIVLTLSMLLSTVVLAAEPVTAGPTLRVSADKGAAVPSARDQVAMLVPRAVHVELKSDIERYRRDVEARFPVDLLVQSGTWATPDDVRARIRELYGDRRIAGVVLVGAVPMHRFHMHGFPNPNPLYYEAFDLPFTDRNGDGFSDVYASKPQLKLWVANIRCATGDADSGVDGLRTFFRKTHAYYEGRTAIDGRALAVTASDWPDGADWFAREWGRKLFGADGVSVLKNKDATPDTLRAAFMKQAYSMFYIQVHSTETGQDLEGGTLSSEEISEIGTGALFTVNHGCSNCNWARNAAAGRSKNTGMSWVFGKGIGQALVGNVRTGMVYGQGKLYERILAGDYLGKAYFAAKQAAEEEMFREYPAGDTVSGVLFIGNPFLYLKPPAPPVHIP